MELNSTEEIIDDIRQGKMVILMDDEDRENEGDLIIAAERVRTEDINFMATNARGLICLTLTKERCEFLGLPLMVNENNTPYNTNFTISIEAATGVTTGISAADRARTHTGGRWAGKSTGRYRPAGSHFPDYGPTRWGIKKGWPYRGWLRSGEASWVLACRSDCRDHE